MFIKYIKFSCLLAVLMLAFSCEEVPPIVDPCGGGGGGPGPGDNLRKVLIEEFTGVRCVNCPAGSDAIEALLGVHGEQLVAVSIHAGTFAVPHSESQQNLANPTGSSILSLLGSPLGFPTAVVNRTQYSGEERRQVGLSTWAGYIAEELAKEPEVRIEVETGYNDGTREVTIDADFHILQDITADDVRLTVFVTENNIIDSQTTPEGRQDDYVHKHVFRTAVSAFDGNPINDDLSANGMISRSLSVTLDELWDVNECHIVVFLHQGGGTLDVIQAEEVSVL